MFADPKFIDKANNNFHLQSDSPCKDTGTDVGLTQDYEGNTVPYNSIPDIGAYEYMPTEWASFQVGFSPQPHIEDATGNIGDTNIKFNTLLDYLQNIGALEE